MISYEELFRIWKEEVSSEDLTELPEGFYERAARLVAELRSGLKMADMGTLRARLARRELENVEKMVKDIFDRRVEKVLKALSSGEGLELENLTPEERELFTSLETAFSALEKFIEGVLRGEVRGPEGRQIGPKGAEGRPKLMLVRILAEVPAIVGADMRTHGPFKPGDVAFIPTENALALVRKGLAVEVELA